MTKITGIVWQYVVFGDAAMKERYAQGDVQSPEKDD